jgi:hypothetical protein
LIKAKILEGYLQDNLVEYLDAKDSDASSDHEQDHGPTIVERFDSVMSAKTDYLDNELASGRVSINQK